MKANWKKVSYCLSTIVLLVFIGGCTAEHLANQAQVSAVSAKRSLPKTYMPGEPVKVILDLDVLPGKATIGRCRVIFVNELVWGKKEQSLASKG